MKKIFLILLSLALFTACERKIDTFTVSNGSANFKKYIAVGNSFFAGYADGALYHNGQKYSIPNLIAGQLQLAGSGSFVQPMVTSEFGVDFIGSTPKLKLGPSKDCKGVTSLGPVYDLGTKDPLVPVGYDVNNFAVPGAKSFHILASHYGDPALLPLGEANPYFFRFAKAAASSVLSDAMASNATFFTLWLGDNDVLSYALSGGLGDTITSPAFFQTVMGGILHELTLNGAKGVIATIPDVTSFPFFATIPYNGLVLTKSEANSVNMAMKLYGLPDTNYVAGANPFLIPDPTSLHPYFKVRQMKPGELVLMTVPQDSMKCIGMGIISKLTNFPYPIPKQYILTLDDISKLQAATSAYNQIITALAATFKLGVVDMNSKLKELQKGIVWDGITLNTTFVTGGAFSLDGINLNPRGCALVANFFIEAINKQYGSTVPYVDITKYPGVIFP
ncbi:MAG: hypothetical protein ABSE72_06490 [Bacteroidales bacterium]|jgi:hypothetical protein